MSRFLSKWVWSSCALACALLWIRFEAPASALGPGRTQEGRPIEIPLGLDLHMPVPEANPLTAVKVNLGRSLFFDPILSSDQSLSCSGCHQPGRAFTDGRAVSVGVLHRKGTRNVPTLINRGYGRSHFWDGRSASLEEQVLRPIQDPNELDMTVGEVVGRLHRDPDYPRLFDLAFGQTVSAENLAKALASYVRTILSGNAPIDHYLNGQRNALSEEARQGLGIFRGKANCIACHVGPNFTDEKFHNSGVAWRSEPLDPGRFAVTGDPRDLGAFKTPTLRQISRTAPYMHDGSIETLEDVVEFYDRGGKENPHLDPEIRPLGLTSREKRSLLTFLRSLTGVVREGVRSELEFSPAKDRRLGCIQSEERRGSQET